MRPRVLLALSAGVAVAILAYAVLAPSGLSRLNELQTEQASLAADTAARAAENARLAEQARVLRGDDATSKAVLEKAAREELGMIKPGEIVVVLPTAAPPAEPKSARE
jgi:cell division protein FtsB